MKDTSQVQGVLFEPSLQRKKKLESSITCLSSDFSVKEHDSNEDYMLLGKNEKFEGNICYKPKRHFNKKKKENDDNQIYAEEESCDPHIEKNHTNGTVPADSYGGVSPEDEEYILLGNQAKFSENIVYRQKKRMLGKSAEIEQDFNENQEIRKHTEEESFDPHMQAENIEKNHIDETVPVDSYGGATPDDEEYILLGNHAKFSDNVVYKRKKRMNNMLSKNAETEYNFDKNENQYPATKDLKPAPIVDTSKFSKSSKAIMLDNLKPNEKHAKGFADKDNKSVVSNHAVKELTEFEGEEIMNPAKSPVKKSVMFETSSSKNLSDNEEAEPIVDPVKKSVISENSSPTKYSDNQEKLSGLLYKSGLGLPRSSAMRSSEYQNNFTVKKPLKTDSSVAKSKNSFLSGSYFNRVPSQNNYQIKKSEYQRNFCSPQSDNSVSSNPPAIENKDSCVEKIKHPRRSKSVNSKRTEKMDALAKSVSTEDVYPRKKTSPQPVKNTEILSTKSETSGQTSSKRSEDSDRTEPKHGMKRAKSLESVTSHPELKKDKSPPVVLMSEYQKNFNSPSSFAYIKNAWVNKDPKVTTENISHQDWYNQVLELRERAANYRQRAFDSHFCSKHMVQLISKETERWENSRKLLNTAIDPSQMKPAGITYYPPRMFSFKNTNKLRSLPPSVNNECKIVLEEVEEVLVPDNKDSKLVKDDEDNHQDIKDQECNNDVGKTETIAISIEEEQNLAESENLNPVTDKEETIDVRVAESITKMMSKNDLRCLNKTNNSMMKTNHLKLSKANNSELSIKYQPPSTKSISDNKLNGEIQQLDEDLTTEPKDLRSDTSKTETTTEDNIDADNEVYHLNLASKVSENYRKPKQVSKSCDSMFARIPLFGKSSKNKPVRMQQHQELLPNSKSSKKFHDNFLSMNKPIASTKGNKSNKNSCSKRTKPLKSQENLPFKNIARSNMTSALHPHYEHMSDTYNVRPRSKFDPHYHKSSLNEHALSESLDTSGSLISDVLERTRKRMNFW